MATVIRDGSVANEHWQRLDAAHWLAVGEDGLIPTLPAEDELLVPLALFQIRRAELLARRGRTGVLLEAADAPEALAADLGRLALVSVRFAAFTDGRGYSSARLLRERFGFRGELRAEGDVGLDQLHQLWRCGFNAFELQDDVPLSAALNALNAFSEAYQASAERSQPLFRRRLLKRAA